MKMTLLKQNAKKQLSRNLGTMILCLVILGILTFIELIHSFLIVSKYFAKYAPYTPYRLSLFQYGRWFRFDLERAPILNAFLWIFSIAMFIFLPALILGKYDVYLKSQKGERVQFSQMFQKFDQFGKAFVMNLLIVIFIALKFLLLIVPGIIAIYQYSMSYFVLADNPELGPYEAIKQSKKLMKGHKLDLFVLQFSFFWWVILFGITFGLAAFYVEPYVMATEAEFYNKIKQSKEELISQKA